MPWWFEETNTAGYSSVGSIALFNQRLGNSPYGLGNSRHEIDGNQFLFQVHRRGATGLEKNVHKGMGNGQTGR